MTFLNYLAQHIYCKGLMIFLGLVALVISIRYYRRHKSLRIFAYYITFSLLESMTVFYYFASPPHAFIPRLAVTIVGNTFTLFEFIICNLFILHYIRSPRRRQLIRMNGLLFFVILILIYFRLYRNGTSVILLESVFLVFPCLIYFYELFLTVNLKPLKDQPSFWIITATLFLNACCIPLELTIRFLGQYKDAAFSINDILYGILFIMLIKAYLCRPENRRSYE